MASASNTGDLHLYKRDLTIPQFNDEGALAFTGSVLYRQEITDHFQATQLDLEEEGSHCKCNTIAVSVLAVFAAAAAGFLMWNQGMNALIPTLGLGVLSTGFVIWAAIEGVSSHQRKKAIETLFQDKTNEPVTFAAALTNMSSRSSTFEENQAILRNLDDARRETFIEFICQQDLDAISPDVFRAMCFYQDQILKYVDSRDRAFAIRVLQNLTDEAATNQTLIDKLIPIVNSPDEGDEATALALSRFPLAVDRYLLTFSESADSDTYKLAILENLPADQPAEWVKKLFVTPESEKHALTLIRHRQTTIATAADADGRAFSLAMMQYLPPDHDAELLAQFLAKIDAPSTQAGADILIRHPLALSEKIKQGGRFAVACISFAIGQLQETFGAGAWPTHPESIANYAEHPETVAKVALSLPQWFSPEVVYEIFTKMDIQAGNLFLTTLADLFAQNPVQNSHLKLVARAIINNLMSSPEWINRHNEIPAYTIPQNHKAQFKQLGRWPEEIAQRIFVTDFGSVRSLLNASTFLTLFFENIDPAYYTACIEHAAHLQNHQHNAPTIYARLIQDMDPMPTPLIQLMANTPTVIAKVLSQIQSPQIVAKIEQLIVAKMTLLQRQRFDVESLRHFAETYTSRMVANTVDTALQNTLLQHCIYLLDNPDWVVIADNQKLARQYCEILTLAGISDRTVLNRLMKVYPALFTFFEVEFPGKGAKLSIPACRLAAASDMFLAMITNSMKEADAKKIPLQPGTQCEPEVARLFLGYLLTGEVTLTPENYNELAFLAETYRVSTLADQCATYVETIIDEDNLRDVLLSAIIMKSGALQASCFKFIAGNTTKQRIQHLANDPRGEPSVRDFVKLALECARLGIQIKNVLNVRTVLYKDIVVSGRLITYAFPAQELDMSQSRGPHISKKATLASLITQFSFTNLENVLGKELATQIQEAETARLQYAQLRDSHQRNKAPDEYFIRAFIAKLVRCTNLDRSSPAFTAEFEQLKDMRRLFQEKCQFMLQNPAWLTEDTQSLAKRYCEVLADIGFEDHSLLDRLMTQNPSLFNAITVEFPGKAKMSIPAIRLVAESAVFHTLLQNPMQEPESRVINCEGSVGEKAARHFLHYLLYGEMQCEASTVIELALLAQKYEITRLSDLCIAYVTSLLERHEDNLKPVLISAAALNVYSVKLLCIHYIASHLSSNVVINLTKDTNLDQPSKDLFGLGITCGANRISVDYTPGSPCLKMLSLDEISLKQAMSYIPGSKTLNLSHVTQPISNLVKEIEELNKAVLFTHLNTKKLTDLALVLEKFPGAIKTAYEIDDTEETA